MATQLYNAHRHDGLNADVNTTIVRQRSRRPLHKCKENSYNYCHDALYADVA